MWIPTSRTGRLPDFLRFLAACYPGDPDALRRRGADEAAIAALEGASGFPLPAYYRAFLKEFGADTGYTHVGGDGFATVDALLDHHADPVEMKGTPPGGVVIATSGLMPNRMLVIPSDSAEPIVGCFTDAGIDYYMSASFEHLLYQEAWVYARFVNRNTHVTCHHGDPTRVLQTASAIEEWGLDLYWFSDSFGAYGESADAWACARADKTTTLVWIGSESASVRERLRDDLRGRLGFIDERDFAKP